MSITQVLVGVECVGCGVNGSKVLLNAYTKGLLGCAGKCII